MVVLKSIKELREFRQNLSGSIGFVPTMGALHNGHATLIKESKKQNDFTIVSVFVNPTQFLPDEDLEKYPRNEERDIEISKLSGADAIFFPQANEMYSGDEPKIKAPNLANILEGKTRPGHFDGVLSVLIKFFSLIKPTRAYFGKKDTQQLIMVQNMVKSFFLELEIVPVDIVREIDGLALSSRNSYLNDEQKCYALKISRALFKASKMVQEGKIYSKDIKEEMAKILEPLRVDYIAITDRNLSEIEKVEPKNSIILVAAYLDKVRLIDNIWI